MRKKEDVSQNRLFDIPKSSYSIIYIIILQILKLISYYTETFPEQIKFFSN